MATDTTQSPNGDQVTAHLGKGSRISGKLCFEGAALIEGNVQGEITAQDNLMIGESAVVDAQLSVDSIVIIGKVTGDIIARGRIEIRAPGKVCGNITTPSLVIHEGVVFEGQCSMSGGETQKVDKTSPGSPAANGGDASTTPKPHSEVEW
jgi:cytoskeletal protein CcmA (bactofilin family)